MHSPDQPNRIRVFLLSYRVKQLGPMNYWINNLSFINILTYSKDDSFVDFDSCDSWTRIKMAKQTDIEHFHPLHVLRCGLPSNLVLTCQLCAYLRKMINLFFERVTCPDDQVMTFYLASITNKINVVLKLLTFLKEFQVVQ